MIALTVLSIALTLLALGLQVNPQVHNATLSWILIATAVFLIGVSGVMALTGKTQSGPRIAMDSGTREFIQRIVWIAVVSLLPVIAAILFSNFAKH